MWATRISKSGALITRSSLLLEKTQTLFGTTTSLTSLCDAHFSSSSNCPTFYTNSRPFTSSPPPPSSAISPAFEKQVLYRGKGIKLFRLLVRMKIFQLTGIAALAIPVSAFINTGEISHLQALIAGSLIVGSGVASTTLWYYSRRYVGELSLLRPLTTSSNSSILLQDTSNKNSSSRSSNNTPKKVRFSVLDFWGNREDVDVPIEDLIPPLEGLQPGVANAVAAEPFLPVQASGDRQFIISLRYGQVVDKEGLKGLLEGKLLERQSNEGEIPSKEEVITSDA